MQSLNTDLAVIGNGIVGAATALELQSRFPEMDIVLVDKEQDCALHQTGRNSGVVHAGVYYAPGSLKARLCKKGAALTRDFCLRHRLPYAQCGKLLVATDDLELERMEALRERCRENGIAVEPVSCSGLRKREPDIVGKGALFVPATAITDYARINRQLNALFQEQGGKILFGAEVTAIREQERSVHVEGKGLLLKTRYLIACGGLMADRLARMAGLGLAFQIIPFRGEYYRLPGRYNDLITHLIYPIPDPALPFLGVHLTRMIDGYLTVGPNAVLGWKREGYGRMNISPTDIAQMVSFPGFWRVISANLQGGLREMTDSLFKRRYLRRVQKYCPRLKVHDLLPHPAGIRAQAVMADGRLVHDFLFAETPRSLHVCNAPSPAATSALPIGEYLADTSIEKFGL